MKILILLVIVECIHLTYQAEWSYDDESHWPEACHTGNQQSPINILSREAVVDSKRRYIKKDLQFRGYEAVDLVGINNGHTLKWKTVEGSPTPTLSGGALTGNYTFQQFHIHLLSEHAIDGVKYPMEIHLVHSKTGISVSDALTTPDGLAVIGVFCQVKAGKDSEQALKEIIEMVPDLVNTTDAEPVQAEIINLERLFSPSPQSFYAYRGSLTTPNCNEVVQWIVMDQPIIMSDSQYKQLSKVQFGGIANYRSLQPTRTQVYRSASSCASLMTPGVLGAVSIMYHCTKILFSNALCKAWNVKKLFGLGNGC